MMTSPCPNCGRPTAETYGQRHDDDYCSPMTSPNCWRVSDGPVHYLTDFATDQIACGSDGHASSSRSDVTCPDCLARI